MSDKESRDRRRWNTNLTAAAAAFTAVLAVVVAIWDNVETRRHNRLSVLPYVVLERLRNDSDPITSGEISMRNAGVGPAILRGLDITFPTEQGKDTTVTAWGGVAELIRRNGVQIHGWADPDSGGALGVQEEQVLLSIEANGEGSGQRVQSVLDQLRLRLRYSSVYGDADEATLGSGL